ncbi:MAG: hypothetical protein JETCAE03_32870 [Ignavibacteriaceae bacterium]|nr:MAG: hypothetical protein JETCAE03_32870 [Ignavibacteriaceae bacterium]
MDKINVFITGESGVIPNAMQHILFGSEKYRVINSQIDDAFHLKDLKTHQSFKIREPELDFLDNHLLNHSLSRLWEDVDIIVHSGAYVGTDFCNEYPQQAISTNVQGTKNIVDICNKYDIKLIYFSTTAIFDPADYSETKPITEKTNIKPQTLYGITKYAGEMIVKQLCEQKTLVVRPVFGFGDFPHDLHSAITKIIYTAVYNDEYNTNKKLKVLLNPTIKKSYTRVENIVNAVIKLLDFDTHYDEVNIGENHTFSMNWEEMFGIIKRITGINASQYIDFEPHEDYLHWHNIDNSKMMDLGIDFNKNNYIDFDRGISKTFSSTLENVSYIKPYWI